ncbi:MAG: TetR/AcrR family transcriptional regulator [Chloroflexi bacterium]|nr:TetR/AcrR family transcriptional regulator [Chloroflexota bacterium]
MCAEASQTRERLLEAGQALFSDQGYAATSMRQVAEKAGLALGGVYNHFPSKEAIFQAILLEYNPFTRCNLRPLPENFDQLQVKKLLAELEKQPEFFNLILIELLEFKGKHLPRLFENISGHGPPPESWRTLLSLVISYRTTQILLACALPPGAQTQLSPDAVLDFILNNKLAPE